MSWLSAMFGGGGEDPEAVRQRAAGQAAEATRIAQQQAQQQQDQFAALMATLAPAPTPAPDPRIAQREDMRTGATSAINNIFGPGFESTAVPNTMDDELASAIYGEQRGKADDYISRLLKRGVITDTGAAAASKNLDDQGARVRTQLHDLGAGLLEAERGKLTGIADKGREAASTVDVGQAFDPNAYTGMFQSELGDFNSKFGDAFRAGVPGDLFDVGSLSSIAGGAQGAGNKAFDPNAVTAGVLGAPGTETSSDEDPLAPQKKRTTSVF